MNRPLGELRQSRVYRSWADMIQRCTNPKRAAYPDYGGRGITVCDRWRSFWNFYEDMGDRPEATSLDRIDNAKGYEPGNCRWATRQQQNSNTRRAQIFEMNGERRCIAEWARLYGVRREMVKKRVLVLGMTIQDALTIPPQPGRKFDGRMERKQR